MVDAVPTPCHYANWNVGRNGSSTTPCKATRSLMLLITAKLISTTFKKKLIRFSLTPQQRGFLMIMEKHTSTWHRKSWVFAHWQAEKQREVYPEIQMMITQTFRDGETDCADISQLSLPRLWCSLSPAQTPHALLPAWQNLLPHHSPELARHSGSVFPTPSS